MFDSGVSAIITAENVILPGDVNMDTLIDVLDLVLTINYALGNVELSEDQLTAADVNADGNIDVLDMLLMVSIIIDR